MQPPLLLPQPPLLHMRGTSLAAFSTMLWFTHQSPLLLQVELQVELQVQSALLWIGMGSCSISAKQQQQWQWPMGLGDRVNRAATTATRAMLPAEDAGIPTPASMLALLAGLAPC